MQKPQEMLRKILAVFSLQTLSEVNESSGKQKANLETGIGGDYDKIGSMLDPLLRTTFATLSQVSVQERCGPQFPLLDRNITGFRIGRRR